MTAIRQQQRRMTPQTKALLKRPDHSALIRLIVGLGNPGAQYADTRHNVGAQLVTQLVPADQGLQDNSKLQSAITKVSASQTYHLMIPATYMNHSGTAVQKVAHFYKIPPDAILVIHDELDFPAGEIRLKQAGGHGGHNGLRDIIQQLNSNAFWRLRIGIDHPGDKSRVSSYVLQRPSTEQEQAIGMAFDRAVTVIPDMIAGMYERAMRTLHQRSN